MSWLDKVENDIIIQCGDGKEYRPNWMNATKKQDWQISQFNYERISGTHIVKKQSNGGEFGLDLYFQGDDHLDISDAFSRSSNDPRPWVMIHPLYGRLNVHPISLTFDNSDFNVTKITGTISETIIVNFPQSSFDPVDQILNLSLKSNESFANSVSAFSNSDITDQLNTNQLIYNQGEKIVTDKTLAENYYNAFAKANSFVLSATSSPIQAMRQIQSMINLPYEFETNIENRLGIFTEQIRGIRQSLDNLSDPSSKQIFQINIASILGGMCLTSSTPTSDDYLTRSSVLSVISTIISSYNQYIVDLDSIKTDNNGDENSFMPDFYAQNDLSTLVSFTLSNLFTIALGSKQERTYICEEDTNVILLAHRFLGLKEDDTTITTMMNVNNLGLNELLIIRKGRTIVYLV